MTSRYRRDALSVAHSTGWELRPTSEGQLSEFQHTAPHPPCTHGLEDSGRTIAFWDVDSPERLRVVPSLPERSNRRRFLLRGVPDDLIYPRCVFALIFRHPFHSKRLAAKRVE